MSRLAWFSPMPPERSGIAAYSAEVVAALRTDHEIDVFADRPPAPTARSAHDFVWEHQQRPYDLTVYQLGNSSFHDFIWPYLFRYPGLAVLHDAHLHHARAATLLRTRRGDDYRAEFAANHPDAPAGLVELAVAGFDNYLYYRWPMRRLAVEVSRATAVHATLMAEQLADECPTAVIETIRLAHGEPVDPIREADARARVRSRHGIADSDVVFAVIGALTPQKRIPQVLEAFTSVRAYVPNARLILAGAPASHYDVREDVQRRELADAVIVTGYLDDEELTDYVAACDVSLNLRWPTAREMSGPWLRALAAGRATITIDLAHMADIPSLDPRSWSVVHAAASRHASPEPVMVAIDLLDEAHSLRLAMRRLATDAGMRARLGASAQAYWRREHSPAPMLDDYRQVISRTLARPAPRPDGVEFPQHLFDRGERTLHALLHPFPGVEIQF